MRGREIERMRESEGEWVREWDRDRERHRQTDTKINSQVNRQPELKLVWCSLLKVRPCDRQLDYMLNLKQLVKYRSLKTLFQIGCYGYLVLQCSWTSIVTLSIEHSLVILFRTNSILLRKNLFVVKPLLYSHRLRMWREYRPDIFP